MRSYRLFSGSFYFYHNMPTFHQCYLEYRKRPDAIQFSKKKIKKLHQKIKWIYDRHENPPISYLESQEDGKTYLVRDYPYPFKKTIVGLLNRLHKKEMELINEENVITDIKKNFGIKAKFIDNPFKKKRVRKQIIKPEFSAKPKL